MKKTIFGSEKSYFCTSIILSIIILPWESLILSRPFLYRVSWWHVRYCFSLSRICAPVRRVLSGLVSARPDGWGTETGNSSPAAAFEFVWPILSQDSWQDDLVSWKVSAKLKQSGSHQQEPHPVVLEQWQPTQVGQTRLTSTGELKEYHDIMPPTKWWNSNVNCCFERKGMIVRLLWADFTFLDHRERA